MPAYIVSGVTEMKDEALMAEYAELAGPTVGAHGGKLLARGAVETLDGDYAPGGGVIIEFPNAEAVRNWYNSPEYQKIVDMRFRAVTSTLLHYTNEG